MADIFDEVEEELRRDRALQLWKRYGWLAVALAVVLAGGIAGWRGWTWQQQRAAEAATADLLQAQRQSDDSASSTALETIAREGRTGLATLARLTEAARLASAGQVDKALPLWQAVAGDGAAGPLYRDLAGLLIGMHTLDTADPLQLAARLAPIASPDNPWHHLAAELQALLAERRGDRAAAVAGFRVLATDATSPPGVRSRAEAMLSLLSEPGGGAAQ